MLLASCFSLAGYDVRIVDRTLGPPSPHGNVTVSRQDIGSWLVSAASVGEGGASWWKW